MSTPAAKRRRLDDAQSALRKPFKSPFKTPVKPSTDTGETATAAHTPLAQSALSGSSPAPETARPDPSDQSTTPVPRKSPSTRISTPLQPSASSPFARRKPAPDDPLAPAIRAEEQRQRQLTRQIATLRSELDTLNQALTIASSTKDAELEQLIQKWRDASRAAAEEVFATVRDRVNRMGGVGAWREREQQQQEWRQGFGREEEEGDVDEGDEDEEDEDEELGAEEKEVRRIAKDQRAEARAEAKRERQWRKEEWERERQELEAQQPRVTDEGRDDDTFTMDMMLKTLNIDVEIVGWDKAGQRWIG